MTGGGKTAIYVELLGRLAGPRPARPRPRARDRPRAPARGPAPRGPRCAGRDRPLGAGRRRARGRVAADPSRRRRRRRRAPGWPCSRRSPTSGSSSSTRSTTRPTRATGRRGSRRATSPSSSGGSRALPVVLGSATPSVETEGRARDGSIVRHRLPSACSGAPPEIEVVDLRAELAAGNLGMLSRSARRRPRRPERGGGDQAILVINRRGTASVVLCRDCGYVATCPDCTRPLVFHQAGRRCAATTAAAPGRCRRRCPQCGSARIRYLGGGTERVEREVRERFPALRVGRLDRDVAERKGAAERVIDAFTDQPARRPRRNEPRDQGPRHPGRDARRASCPPTSR